MRTQIRNAILLFINPKKVENNTLTMLEQLFNLLESDLLVCVLQGKNVYYSFVIKLRQA